MFGWFEQWPRRLPKWLPRTVLQTHRHRGGDSDCRRRSRYAVITGGEQRARRSKRWLMSRGGCCSRRGSPSAPSCGSAMRSRASRRSGVRARAQRIRAPRVGCAPAAAAGAGRAALPVQHAGQRAGAGGLGIAAGLEGAHQPHRLSTRGRAAHALADHHAGDRSGPGARLSRSHADAHAGPTAVRDPPRSGRGATALSADDAADAGRECRAPRHRSERGGRAHRCRHLDAR